MATIAAIAARRSRAMKRIAAHMASYEEQGLGRMRPRGKRARNPELATAEDLEWLADVLDETLKPERLSDLSTHGQLIQLLSEHAGEAGSQESAVETLRRVLSDHALVVHNDGEATGGQDPSQTAASAGKAGPAAPAGSRRGGRNAGNNPA